MSRSFFRTYGFLSAMLLAIVLGCVLGALWPGATCLAPLGTIFINLMFCIVVPLVFCSLSSSIACMKSPKRAGKIMGTTLLVFIVTGLIAAVIMLFAMRLYPPVLEPWADAAAGAVDEQASVAQLLVNFFTVEDFAALLSRRAMLPLIVFSILIGFGVNLSGGADCLTAKVLQDMTNCLLKVVSLISYYAPVAFFGFFASLVATYGAQITAAYGRAMLVYYPLCFVYALVAFPLYAYASCGGISCARGRGRGRQRRATSPTSSPLGATMHMDGSCFSCVLRSRSSSACSASRLRARGMDHRAPPVHRQEFRCHHGPRPRPHHRTRQPRKADCGKRNLLHFAYRPSPPAILSQFLREEFYVSFLFPHLRLSERCCSPSYSDACWARCGRGRRVSPARHDLH